MTERRVKVLIIDENAGFLEEAATELSGHFTVYTSASGGDGLKVCARVRPQVVIVDAGVSDVSFPDLLDDLKGLDGAVLRIATSRDYSGIEEVVQAIETTHIHKYFRKPVNYLDLIEIINAKTMSYQMGRGAAQAADASPAYKKLNNIVDKAKEVEQLRRQLESQMAKIRDVEAESFDKMKTALEETLALRKKVADKDAMIGSLQVRSQELEELKKRDGDRVEQEREALRHELKDAKEECGRLLQQNSEIGPLKSDNERLRADLEILRAEIGDLKVSVVREREAMVEGMERERKTFLEELERKMDEAERIIEVQKERNRAELQALQAAFEGEKQQAVREIERRKAELEANRRAGLEEIEQIRKRAEADLEKFRRQQAAEKAAIDQRMEEDKKRAAAEIAKLKAEFDLERQAKLAKIETDRKRVAKELAGLEEDRKRVEGELARKKEEAEHAIEQQKERNRAELKALQDAFEEEKRTSEQKIGRLKAEFAADREAKLAEIEAGRKRVEAELAELEANRARVEADLARKKDEAERAIALQKERNKAELEALQAAFKEEQQRAAWYEIEQLKAELERDRQAKLAKIEADRKRSEQELSAIKIQMRAEKEQLEKGVQEQREKAEAEIRRLRDAATLEQKRLTEALDAKLAAMTKEAEAEVAELKASATRELERVKAATQKRELELSEALIQARRMTEEREDQLKLTADRMKALESEVEKRTGEKDLVLQELESVRADYDVVIRSREALKAEVAELRENLR